MRNTVSMKLFRKILTISALFFLICLLTFFGYYFIVTGNVSLQSEKLNFQEENIRVYDNEGAIINAVLPHGEARSISLQDVPEKTKLAFINTEDKLFFTHNGFDYKRMLKAILCNLKSGKFQQGASTISQQLIKNTHLSQEKTLKRKLKEWKLTKRLEKKYSKEEILEKYLSVIYFGHNCFGLNSASNFYFGKSVNELDLADSAVLAGLVQSPNNYSPFKNPQNCLRRKEIVLRLMQKNGSITEKEKQIALEKPLPTQPHVDNRLSSYMRFVFDEFSALSQEYDFTVGGRIEIHTYLDKNLQNAIETIANEYNSSDKNLTVLDAKNHGFKACVSTLGESRRLPGSLIKPLLVYAPALEENVISPATPILDEKINYAGYAPNNYDGTFHGYVSARECLAQSLNVPAVKLLETITVERAVEYLKTMQLPVEKEDYSLALALGGMKNGFTMKELLSAYSVFPNEGEYTPCGFISEIKIDNVCVYTKPTTVKTVFSKDTSYLMSDMLKTTAKTGTAKKLRSFPFDISAKTGTVGVEKGNTDAYALSYTNDDVVGVWLGNANNAFIDCTGGGTPCNLLLKINEFLYKKYTPTDFIKPMDVVEIALDKVSYEKERTLRLADEVSPIEYRFHELFKKTCIPQTKSEIFSSPSIIQPHLSYENNKVVICFHENSPSFYQYKIERFDQNNNKTVYFGKRIERYTDNDVQANKKYVYTVTPLYGERTGIPIVLPSVSTYDIESSNNQEILDKNWWEY